MAWILSLLCFATFAHAGENVCGLGQSSVQERIRDCSRLPGSSKISKSGAHWDLVARSYDAETKRYYEVWKDWLTGFIWGDRLNSLYSNYEIVEAYPDQHVESPCNWDEALRADARITEVNFHVPSTDEWGIGPVYYGHGIEDNYEVLPNMDSTFWTSTVDFDGSNTPGGWVRPRTAWYIAKAYGNGPILDRREAMSVRCVGKEATGIPSKMKKIVAISAPTYTVIHCGTLCTDRDGCACHCNGKESWLEHGFRCE